MVDVVWSDRTTAVGLRVECALIAGDIALSTGKLGEAEAWYEQAAKLLKPKHGPGIHVRVERRRAELDALRQHPRALERVTAAARAAHRARATRDLSRLHAIRGYLLACAQRTDEVGPSLERAESPLRDAGAGRLLAEVRIWAARGPGALGGRPWGISR